MEKVLVIGGARSGCAVAKLLHRQGYDVSITDQKQMPEKEELESLGIHVYELGHPDCLKTEAFHFVVKNPGIPYHAPFIQHFVKKQIPIYTEIEIAYRYAPHFQYGAVTGTNGKTTITSILYELLSYNKKALVAGNIGTPLSECVLAHREEEKQVAIELSNFQLLGCESFHPIVSVICNLSPDHLDYMGSVDAYYQSKMKIYAQQTKDDWFLRNVDDEIIMEYAQNIPAEIIDFSLVREDVDLYLKDHKVILRGVELFDTTILKIVGMHNISNAMIAACMAYKMGVSIEHIREGLSKFQSVEHRLEFIVEKEGVRFYNDSKATNPEAVVPALKAFDKNIILLAGGYDKKLPFTILQPFDQKIKQCIAFGETKRAFQDIFTHTTICETMKEALQKAVKIAQKGDVILLSPACASYDQFTSYEERGKLFKEYVLQYVKENERN
ncbi:MAG: UDP-N-acetylmuramoyl-L-alanine--D-glutamate ligase [Erysipelotrichia bacterium]|nr:UDP-N-acetylmuramoyl-L-alanine--D-glutamate ligase [Erysipelotrichia bacterium]NCC55403.1 UDP-N-acetylmuramoyl-L-alanine--D-glutamate ligase [Erysipelotrichia bacterium]